MGDVSAARLPGIGTCLYEISAIKLRLRLFGFQRTLRFATTTRQPVAQLPDPVTFAEHVAHRVAFAAAFYPTRARCLEQSLTLYHLLRRNGVDVQFRLGVQPYRFRAHAWVEYQGAPINEPGDGVTGLAVLPEIPR